MTNGKQDEFDRMLDAALANYASVEPRTGLEERVLANLRAEQAHVPDHAWWRSTAIAAVAAVIVVAMALSLRSDKPSHPVLANHPPTPIQAPKERGTEIISLAPGSGTRPARPNTARKPALRPPPPEVAMARAPKLEQFPSPQPLSEQEKLLQNYIAENPEQAVLLARARTEALRRDQLEEVNSFPSGDPARDSEERNHGTTDR
jgi:hypothetical protein